MLWRKRGTEEKSKQKKTKGVEGISGSAVWSYMNSQLGIKGEVLMTLRRVETDGVVEDKPATMIRIFDPTAAKEKGVAIDDYESLDNHPDLIVYEGYYCETRGRLRSMVTDIHIEKK